MLCTNRKIKLAVGKVYMNNNKKVCSLETGKKTNENYRE